MSNLFENYIKYITIEDIDKFAKKNNIILNEKELKTVHNVIKKDYMMLINNSEEIFSINKKNFTVENYNKIYKLFNKYKKRYRNYL